MDEAKNRMYPFGPDPDSIDLTRWKHLIDELPDIRLDKVAAMRDALRRQELDNADAVEGTLERLSEEISLFGEGSFD